MADDLTLTLTATVLTVRRYADCVRFYRDLIGCSLDMGGPEVPVSYFSSGTMRFALLDHARRPAEMKDVDQTTAGAPRHVLAFMTTDVDAWHARLAKQG